MNQLPVVQHSQKNTSYMLPIDESSDNSQTKRKQRPLPAIQDTINEQTIDN